MVENDEELLAEFLVTQEEREEGEVLSEDELLEASPENQMADEPEYSVRYFFDEALDKNCNLRLISIKRERARKKSC